MWVTVVNVLQMSSVCVCVCILGGLWGVVVCMFV